ncbi:MAG: response regulator [Myxococcales bacterium]|nr:response regulator [Myxococcales bacterium]
MNAVARRILIVDDNQELAENLAELLEDEGHTTTTADSGERAIDISGGLDFDLLLSDVRMPGINGVELVIRLRVYRPRLCCLLMSAYSSEELRREAKSAGVAAILDKPLDLDELLCRVTCC